MLIAIFFYQHTNGNAEMDIDWHQTAPLERALRNDLPFDPPKARTQQRNNFISHRIAGEANYPLGYLGV